MSFALKLGKRSSTSRVFRAPKAKSILAGDNSKGRWGRGSSHCSQDCCRASGSEATKGRGKQGRGGSGTAGVCMVGMGSSALPG